jgi:thioesterase domain-containing protein
MRVFLQSRLPNYMIPTAFVTVDGIPLTKNGKVDRKALPEPGIADFGVGGATFAADEEVERGLAEIWEDLLGYGPVGISDDFFDIGGHSLLVLQHVRLIKKRFGVELDPATIYRDRTIAELAQSIRGGRTPDPATSLLRPLRRGGTKRIVFCVHPIGGNTMCYQPLARHLAVDHPVFAIEAAGLHDETPTELSFEERAAQYIRQVRAMQPDGPYALLGWSLGAPLAFEMAHQLVRQGQEVDPLVLVEGPTSIGKNTVRLLRTLRHVTGSSREPFYVVLHLASPRVFAGERFAGAENTLMLCHFGSDLLMMNGRDETFSYRELRVLNDESERVNYIMQHAKSRGAIPARVDPEEIYRHIRTGKSLFAAFGRYRPPGGYPGRVLVVTAGDREVRWSAGDFGWHRLCSGEFESMTLPGGHLTIIDDPHVEGLGTAVNKYLD